MQNAVTEATIVSPKLWRDMPTPAPLPLTSRGKRWTAEDDRVAAAASPHQLATTAAYLGRTRDAVRRRRMLLKRRDQVAATGPAAPESPALAAGVGRTLWRYRTATERAQRAYAAYLRAVDDRSAMVRELLAAGLSERQVAALIEVSRARVQALISQDAKRVAR